MTTSQACHISGHCLPSERHLRRPYARPLRQLRVRDALRASIVTTGTTSVQARKFLSLLETLSGAKAILFRHC
jgi:hypothetical protein